MPLGNFDTFISVEFRIVCGRAVTNANIGIDDGYVPQNIQQINIFIIVRFRFNDFFRCKNHKFTASLLHQHPFYAAVEMVQPVQYFQPLGKIGIFIVLHQGIL